jgi:hypothetical protein
VVTQADIARKIAVWQILRGRPYPGQRYRHGWIPVAGLGVLGKHYSQTELEGFYGGALDNEEFSPGAIVELGEDGTVHIDLGAEVEDRWHVFGDMTREEAQAIGDAVEWAIGHVDDTFGRRGDRPPDSSNGLVNWLDLDGVIVGYTPDGNIRVGWPDENDTDVNVLDLPRDEAMALRRALERLGLTALEDEEE